MGYASWNAEANSLEHAIGVVSIQQAGRNGGLSGFVVNSTVRSINRASEDITGMRLEDVSLDWAGEDAPADCRACVAERGTRRTEVITPGGTFVSERITAPVFRPDGGVARIA